MKFYKIISEDGWVLSHQYEPAAEMVLGYGGVWTHDHRRAKKFKTIKECQSEVNKMPGYMKYLVVSNSEDWVSEYKKAFGRKPRYLDRDKKEILK